MSRLFWKFFLSFWLALMVFAAATLVAASLYVDKTRERHEGAQPFDRMESIFSTAQAAADGGMESLRGWARQVDQEELVPLLVLDRDGHDILQREVSARALARLRRHQALPPPGPPPEEEGENRPPPNEHPPIRLPDGSEYWLQPDFQGANLSRLISRPRVVAIPLILSTLVGGLVCLLLVRYLAAPIERLRKAATAYGGGDFSHRVGPSLGRRRDEIVDLAFTLDHMAERLDALLRSQQTLLRDVSHELRSPLARLQAALGLIRQRGGAIGEAELDRFEREAERLNDLVGQILSFSRLDSGVRAVAQETLDLAQLVAEAVEDTAIEARNCRLHFEPAPELPLRGDAMLLHSAFDNILRNAARHAPAGSEVTVSAAIDGDWYEVRIADRGPGVPEAMLDRIFEPFVRVDEARTAPANGLAGGFGLGLAIARRAIAAHGGTIAARNRPQGGLVMTIRLPRNG
ncbi:MAG TPA: ATP-binding protein [Rhodocyclaceae bacterium]|nr:ATP-binding protein [Rhodocyclaceae bacterium]